MARSNGSRAFLACMTLATLPAACGSDGSSIDYQGMPGQATPVAFDGWVPIIGASIDGGGLRPFLLDTGAPMTVLDSTAQPGLDEGLAAVELGAFELTFADYQATAWDVFTDSAEGDGVAGIVGGDLLRHFAFSLDYQGARAWLHDGEVPGDLGGVDSDPPLSIPAEILGGGTGLVPGNCPPPGCGLMEYPPTRVLVQVRFEGKSDPVWAMVDSGASAVVLDEDLFDELDSDPDAPAGRPILGGLTVSTVDGDVDAFYSRVWQASLAGDGGDAALGSVGVLVIPGTTLLQDMSAEVHRDVRALIGGTLLRSYLTTFDYPGERLRLAPYRDLSHIPADEWVGPGFLPWRAGSGWVVGDVYQGTDAEAEGLSTGDVILELDGTPITGESDATVMGLLFARPLGDDLVVGLRAPPGQGIAGGVETHMVLVEDLLPAYDHP